MPRITARVGGSSSSAPTMSLQNPGVSRNAPPKITSTPSSTSRAGIRPSASAVWKRRHAARPWDFINKLPRIESAISRAIVHSAPIAWPTWMIT